MITIINGFDSYHFQGDITMISLVKENYEKDFTCLRRNKFFRRSF